MRRCEHCDTPIQGRQKRFCSVTCLREAFSAKAKASRPDAERFWEHVNKDGGSGCWLWTASIIAGGYGHLWSSRKAGPVKAHRFSWELHNGPIPDGMLVLHRCDVRHCVNPDHLFLGTQQDNVIDMWEKGRGDRHQGQNNGFAKLTAEDVLAIRARYRPGVLGATRLAREFGVSKPHIYRILKRRAWTHI